MLKSKQIILSLVSFFFIHLADGQGKITQDLCPVIPSPVVYQMGKGALPIIDELFIDTAKLPKTCWDYLHTKMQAAYNVNCVINKEAPTVRFVKLNNVIEHSYSIHIGETILISYSSDASCFYALNSLFQLIVFEGDSWNIKQAFIHDYPKFEWRGLHLDVSRHFFSVDEVKRFIDLMALYKFNTLHWHLTDDQGWRIEIKKYPLLTYVGSKRDSTMMGHYNDEPRKFDKRRQQGFYTQDQVKEIVAYAKERYVNVVPEIEMPGHSRAALAAYPRFSCTGELKPVPGTWGVFEDIYCSKPETIQFLKEVLDEVLELFPSKYIHIGGDEAPKTNWKSCEKCQQIITENNLKDEHELQSYFIQQFDTYLTSKGRILIGWDEILEGGLSSNAAVMSWRGEAGGVEAAKLKHPVVMTPTTYCYFDYYQSGHPNEPLAIGGFLPIEKVYQFNPIPDGLTREDEPYILGGQANLWTEYINDMAKLEYMTYPRALALSQSVWCFEKPDYSDFKKVLLDYQFDYLKRNGVNYSNAILYPTLQIKATAEGLDFEIVTEKKQTLKVRHLVNGIELEATSINPGDLIHVKRTDANYMHQYTVISGEADALMATEFKFKVHPGIGFPVDFITEPNSKFENRKEVALVDGIKGTLPWKGDDWLGFTEDTIVFEMDLLEKRKLKSLQMGFLEANGSWIYLPKNVEVYYSNDRINWKKGKRLTATSTLSFKFKKKGTYLKFVIYAMDKIPAGKEGAGYTPWTFIDEIEVYYK
jgi:hexosaminidase